MQPEITACPTLDDLVRALEAAGDAAGALVVADAATVRAAVSLVEVEIFALEDDTWNGLFHEQQGRRPEAIQP